MQLLVIRHAIAVERAEEATEAEDAERPLTTRGRRRFKQGVRGLDRLGYTLDVVVHSPWRRAIETADLLGPLVDGDLAEVRRASPNLVSPPRGDLFRELASLGTKVAVVGHEPWLGELVALLTAGTATLGESLLLKKGGVAVLDGTIAPGGMRLLALLQPDVLRRIK